MDSNKLFNLLDLSARVDQLHLDKNDQVQDRDVDGKFHPSGIGGCKRKLSYAFVRQEPRKRIPAKLHRTFEHGHKIHDMLQGWLHKIFNADISGYTSTFEDEVSITGTDLAIEHNIAGSADGLIVLKKDDEEIRIIYEAKSASESSWSRVSSPMAKHVTQANIYAACLNAEYILFDYYNKDKDIHKYFIVPFSQEEWVNVTKTLSSVIDRLNEGELLDREANSFECKTCGYYYDCQPELE